MYDYYFRKLEAFWQRYKKWFWPLVISVLIVWFFDSVCQRMKRPKTFQERVESHLNKWGGSHRELETYIKASMNDPGSYEHVSTKYIMPPDSTFNSAIFITTFRGKNAFGGITVQTVRARCNINTGKVEVIIED